MLGEADGLKFTFAQFLDYCFLSLQRVGCYARQEAKVISHHCPGGAYDLGVDLGNGQNDEIKTGAECFKDTGC